MSNEYYEGIRQRALANRKPESTSSLVLGNQAQPAPTNVASSAGFNAERLQPYKHLFEKYFRPEDATKAMWVSFWGNQGGDPSIIAGVNPSHYNNPPPGRATGLMQILPRFEKDGKIINADRPTQQELMDPETNIREAARLVYGPGGKDSGKPSYWGDWQQSPKPGEEIWGELGAHPYPGDADVRPKLPDTPLPTDYQQHLESTKSALTATASAVEILESNKEIYRIRLAQEKRAEIEKLSTKPKIGQDLYQHKQEYDAQVAEIEARYETDFNLYKQQASQAADQLSNQQTYFNVLNDLWKVVSDKETNIRSVDDLEKFVADNKGNNFLQPWGIGQNKNQFKFSTEQRNYLDKAIKHLAPYVNAPQSAPKDFQQMSEFLAATQSSNVPSKRVSIASLSSDQIKKLLTTSPRQKLTLPPGLTAEKLRAYYSSNNLLDEESQKAINGIQGKAKDLVRQWQNEDARIQAYKLGLADPTNSVPLLKEREGNIVTWGLEKLEWYSKQVSRPIFAYGASAVGNIKDIASTIPGGNALLNIASPGINLFGLIYSNEDTDEIRKHIRQNRMEGQNFWTAAGNAFEEWDGSMLQKMLAETIADPTTYLGFGLYPKIFKPIPYLGRAVEGVEQGWKLAWDNPVVTRAAVAGTGAALGYTITGGEYWGAGVGAGFPLLRHIPIYTSAQLTERIMRPINTTLNRALLTHNHAQTITAISPEQFIDTLNTGIRNIENNPTTYHLTDEGRAVKGLINVLDPWITPEEISDISLRAQTGRELAERTIVGTTEVPAAKVHTRQIIEQDKALAVNRVYDMLLSTEERGIISLDQAVDEVTRILGFGNDEAARGTIKQALTERLQMQTQRVLDAAVGTNAADMAIALLDRAKASALASYAHPMSRHAQFQGFITGLNRKVDPITRNKGYQMLANAQNWYAHSMLSFFNFKPFNYIETHFRAALGGGGWEIPILSDEITTATIHHGWHESFPIALRKGGRGNTEFIKVTKGESGILELSKKKNLITGLADIVSLSFLDDVAKQKQAAAYQHRVWHRLAEENPEFYGAIKELADSMEVTLRAQGLSANEIAGRRQDLLNASLRPDAVEYIRGLKTDISAASKKKLITDVYQKIQTYTNLDQLVTDKVIRDIQAGRILNIDETFEENLDLLLDMPAVKAERGEQALREMRVALEKAFIDGTITTPQQAQELMKFLIDAQQSIGQNAHELRSVATTRGHRIHGSNKTGHWTNSNQALYNYLGTADQEFPAMVEALRQRIQQFFPDEVDRYNTLLDNMIQRNNLSAEARRKDLDVFTSFEQEHGRRPQSREEWDSVNLQRERIWDEYRRRDANLLVEHQVMAHDITPSPGTINDVTRTGLALPQVAELLSSSGDELAQSLVLGNSLQSKETWSNSVYGMAKAKAKTLGKTPEELGWTKEAVEQVYDNLRVRMGTDPAEDSVLFQARQELDSLRKDVHMATLNGGYTQETIDVLNDEIERFAQRIERLKNIDIEVADFTPELINPEPTGLEGISSRYKPAFITADKEQIQFQIGDTILYVDRISKTGKTYEVSVARSSAFKGLGDTRAGYETRAAGSDLQALIESGQIIDDIQRSNPDILITSSPTDERRKRIYIKAGFKPMGGKQLYLDKLNLPRPAPVARPGTATRTLTTPDTEVQDSITRAYEKARADYEHMFTDYENGNIFDAFMRGIFPFWYYQSSRWPYLTTEAFRHPGLITGFGRYQDYSEKGYQHIPGVDLAFNVARGTILMGGMGSLIRQFPATYEDSLFGDFQHGLDQLGRAGFYPGLWTTLPLAALKLQDFEISPVGESVINIAHKGGWDGPATLRDRIFPSKFKEYYTQELASKLSQERELGLSGSDIRRRIESGEATEEEKAVWREAKKQLAGYDLLFDQTGILKLDIEEKQAAAREIAAYFEKELGISKEEQDAITDRLGDSGYRLLDFFPLDPVKAKQLYEMTRYKYWSGNSSVLQPKDFQVLQDKINNFWDEVETLNKTARETGFKDRNGKQQPSLLELDRQFKAGEISSKDYLKMSSAVRTERSIAIRTLKDSPRYKGVPITLEERAQYRNDHDMPMPVQHPAKELVDYYNQIPLEEDKTGEPMWDKYFASLDGLLTALPEEKRNYLLNYIHRDWTDTQKLYWKTNNEFIRPYMNLREGILQSVQSDQQSFLRKYEDATPAMIKNLSEEEAKLVTDFNSALSRARERFRQLDPETDAWLFFWGKTSTVQSEAARKKYNEIVARNGGGVPLTKPIDETKKKILPALP